MSPESSEAAPIGVFDSGVGGLSVLRALQAELPHERFVYLADNGHAPYGERGDAFVAARTHAIAGHLRRAHGIKALVVACNTATAAAIHEARASHPGLPVVGVEPALKPAVAATRTGRVGVVATRGTLASGKFGRLLDSLRSQAEFIVQPCDGLAHAIERAVAEGLADRGRCGCAPRSRCRVERAGGGHHLRTCSVSGVAMTSIGRARCGPGSAPPARPRCPTRPRCPARAGRSTSSRFCSATTKGMPLRLPAPGDAPPHAAVAHQHHLARQVTRVGAHRQLGQRVVALLQPPRQAERASSQRCSGAMALNTSGLSAIEISAPASTRLTPSGGSKPSDHAQPGQDERELADLRQAGRSPSAPCSAGSASQHQRAAASDLPSMMIATTASTCSGSLDSTAGSNSMPTETKNSTANASRSGSDSCAARWLNSTRASPCRQRRRPARTTRRTAPPRPRRCRPPPPPRTA
jgi:hypothetical protein